VQSLSELQRATEAEALRVHPGSRGTAVADHVDRRPAAQEPTRRRPEEVGDAQVVTARVERELKRDERGVVVAVFVVPVSLIDAVGPERMVIAHLLLVPWTIHLPPEFEGVQWESGR
jgi:hypothetical protein